jgi:mitochondrial fission protein ELM1
MTKKLLIWVLRDDRPGNYSQAINLANSLGNSYLNTNYVIKDISYNNLAALPNFLKFGKLSTIDSKSRNNLLAKRNPNIIISAGRRSAIVALDLKKIYPDIFLINIMNPGSSIIKKFDLVIVPKHDNVKADNVIEIVGSVSSLDSDLIEKSYKKFSHIFDKIQSPKIALLLGGSSKSAKFKVDDARNIRKITDNLCKSMNASLLVTTSRRTDGFINEQMQKDNKYIKYYFKWSLKKDNPYLAILKAADYVIVTGDSVSMCCEVCSLGKPVYIYSKSNFCSKKHLNLHEDLFDKSYAKRLNDDTATLCQDVTPQLNELDKVVQHIIKIF